MKDNTGRDLDKISSWNRVFIVQMISSRIQSETYSAVVK